jgi:hypothetical protein
MLFIFLQAKSMSWVQRRFGPFQAPFSFFPTGFCLLFSTSAAIDFENIDGDLHKDYILKKLCKRANAGRFNARKGFYPEERLSNSDPFVVHVSPTILHEIICRSPHFIEFRTDEDC